MKLLLRSAIFAVLFATAASAQFSLGAPQDFLRVGETMQLNPVLRGLDGKLINATDWTWTTYNPDIVSVDSSGNVTGLKLGYGYVLVYAPAEAGALFGFLNIQVQPKNVILTPATLSLQVGQTGQFTAIATDINDQPIPAPGFSWYITTESGDASLVPYNVTIAPDGTFAGGAAGTFTVHAAFFYPNIEYGKSSRFEAFAQAVVTPPLNYSLTRLVSNDPVTAHTLRPAPGFFAGGDSGVFAFSASADGLSTAAVSFSGNTATVLLGTGTPNPQPGGVIAGFQEAAVNSGGDTLVAIRAGDVNNGGLLATPAGGQPRYVLLDNSSGKDENKTDDVNQMTFMHVTRYALNDNGDAVVRALYIPQNGTAADYRNGLFLLTNVMAQTQIIPLVPQLLWSDVQPLDPTVPLSGSPPRFVFAEDNTEVTAGWMGIRSFGIDNNDNVYFMAQSGAARGLFQIPKGGSPKKLLSLGDVFPGTNSTVKSIEDLIVTPAGDVVVTVALQNAEVHLAFYKAGSAILDLIVPGTPTPRILAASSTVVVFEGISAAKQPEGLYIWKPGAKAALPGLLLDANIKYISSAFINSGGAIVAVVQTATNGFVLAQPGAANLFTSGPVPAFSTYISFSNIVHGLRTALPSMLVSSPGSLFDTDGAGNIIPRIVTGDPGFAGTDHIAEDPAGVQYYVSAGTLFRYTGGHATSIVGPGFKAPDGVLITPVRAWSANSQGGVLFECSTNVADGHSRLYLWRNNVLTLMIRNRQSLIGEQVVTWQEAALDDGNRAAVVLLEADGSKDLLLTTDGKTYTTVLNTRTSTLNNGQTDEKVAAIDHIRGAGGGFWARAALTGDYIHAAAITFSGPQAGILVKSGDSLPDGTVLADFRLVDANSKGEIILAGTVNTTGTQVLLFRGTDGSLKIVAANVQQLSTGDYLARFSDINLRDDGTVYFLAFDVNDRALVFRAGPTN